MKSCRTVLGAGFLFLLAGSLAYGQSETSKSSLYPTEIEGKSPSLWRNELKDQDPSKREEAIRVMTMFAPPVSTDVVKTLIELTHDPDISPRTRAVMALGRIEVKKEDVPLIVEALAKTLSSSTQLVVRFEAAKGLARYGDHCQNVIKTLAEAVRERDQLSSWEIRQVCAVALIKAGKVKDKPGEERAVKDKPADERAVKALAFALTDPAAKVRMEAIMGLGYLGHCSDQAAQKAAEERLVLITHSSDKVQAIWAALTLMQIEYADEKDKDRLVSIIVGNFKNTDVRVRTQAVHILGNIGAKAKPYIKDLIKMLDDTDPMVRVTAVDALASLAPDAPLAFDQVVACLKNPDVHVRSEAAHVLGGPAGKAKPPIAKLTDMLTDKEPSVKIAAVNSLGSLASDNPPALAAIVTNLKNPDALVRSESARVLGALAAKGKPYIANLIPLLSDKEPGVKMAAMEALVVLAADAQAPLRQEIEAKLKPLAEVNDTKDTDDATRALKYAATFAIEQISKTKEKR